MSMQCPGCGSAAIQPHAVVNANGTQQFDAIHTGVTSDGHYVRGHSQGSQSTRLAQHCAPPAPPSPMGFLIAWVIGGVLLYGSVASCYSWGNDYGCKFLGWSALDKNWPERVIGLLVIAFGWFGMKVWRSQATNYGRAKRQWQNTWFCHSCGRSHSRG